MMAGLLTSLHKSGFFLRYGYTIYQSLILVNRHFGQRFTPPNAHIFQKKQGINLQT